MSFKKQLRDGAAVSSCNVRFILWWFTVFLNAVLLWQHN